MVIIITNPALLAPAIREELNGVFEDVSDAVEETLKLGKATVKEYISTRGTEKSGKAGRIETGKMLASVRSRKVRFNRSTAEGFFGLGQGPEYSKFQEYGFTHNRTGKWVEGMFAVVDSREVALQFLSARLRSIR